MVAHNSLYVITFSASCSGTYEQERGTFRSCSWQAGDNSEPREWNNNNFKKKIKVSMIDVSSRQLYNMQNHCRKTSCAPWEREQEIESDLKGTVGCYPCCRIITSLVSLLTPIFGPSVNLHLNLLYVPSETYWSFLSFTVLFRPPQVFSTLTLSHFVCVTACNWCGISRPLFSLMRT